MNTGRGYGIPFPRRLAWTFAALLLVCGEAAGAELKPATAAAYERHVADVERRFTAGANSGVDLESVDTRARLRRGEVIVVPGAGDGIVGVDGGLIHDWRALAFIPDASLSQVLAVTQDYPRYSVTYNWVVRSGLLGREHEPGGDRYRVFLRLQEKASVVTATLDVWTIVDYTYPQPGRAIAVSHSACVRQVDHPGTADERLLPAGTGSGFLWRADTFSVYVERDGGVYADFEAVGLTRTFPRLLGWLIEPIARRIGRGSAAESLQRLRQAVIARRGGQVPTGTSRSDIPTTWCSGR